MKNSKLSEVRNLLNRGTLKENPEKEVPKDAVVLPERFFLAIKSTIDGSLNHKESYVIVGHIDFYNNLMLHSTTTLQPPSIIIPLFITSIHYFYICTSYVLQAYFKSSEPLSREIFIRNAVPEFKINYSQCL